MPPISRAAARGKASSFLPRPAWPLSFTAVIAPRVLIGPAFSIPMALSRAYLEMPTDCPMRQPIPSPGEQLMNPSAVTLPSLSMYDPNGNPGRHELWVVKEPAEHQSLLLISGRHGVFLPSRTT